MSGFFNEAQAELVNNLIPEKYRSFFDQLMENDGEIKSVVQYFDSLPDLTEEDLREQADRQKEFFEQMKKKNV